MTTYTLSIVVEGQDRASGPLGGIAGAIGRIGEIAGGVLVAGALQALGQGVVSFASQAINATAQMQAFEMGLQTLVTRELRAADSTLTLEQAFSQAGPMAENLSDAIRKIAMTSPYELSQVQDTFRLAMAFGFASDEATSFTKGLLNVAAGVGASNDMLGRMAYNLAQIRLQGKVTAVDVRQLAMAGFDLNAALKDIGEQFGVTIKDHEDFNKAIADGKIKWEDFATAFESYAEKNFGGAADRMARTFQGLKSTFADFFLLTAPAVFGPALQAVTDFANEVLNSFIALADSGVLEVWGERLGESVTGFMDKLRQLRRLFFLVNIGAMDVGTAIASFLGINPAGFQALAGALSPITQAIDDIFGDLDQVDGNWISGLTEGFRNLFTFIQENGPTISEIMIGLFAKLIEFGGDVAFYVIPFLIEQFVKISDWFVANGPLITAVLQKASGEFGVMLDVIASTWQVIEPILNGLIDLVLGVGTALMQVAIGDWSGAWLTMQATAASVSQAISTAILGFLNMVTGWFGSSWAEVSAMTANNWNMFLQIVATLTGMMLSTIFTFLNNVKNIFFASWGAVAAITVSSWNLFTQTITSATTAIFGAVSTFLNNVKSVWASTWNAISSHLSSIVNQITGQISGMISSLASTISGGAKDMYNAGVSMLQGLADGITKKANEILQKVKQLAADIASAFAGVMQIKSPSRIFIGFGENIIAGLVNGIRATAGLADKAMTDTAQGVQAVMSPFSAAGASGGSVSYGGPISISINGAGDPRAVVNELMRELKSQGLVVAA